MNDERHAALRKSLVAAFEEMAFTFMDWEESPSPPPATSIGAVVSCSSSCDGKWRFLLAVSPKLLPTVAANMLGLPDDHLSSDDQEDALKELANVVCGNFLPAIAGRAAIWDVGAPTIVNPASVERTDDEIHVTLKLEGGVAEAHVSRIG